MRDLLITVAHHHTPERLTYLLRILKAFRDEYALDYDVVIDSNAELLAVTGENVRTVVHTNLEHPFHLTWQHRFHMEAERDNYGWCAYFEDDLLLPFENFLRYMDNFAILWPKYIPSFIRIETMNGVEFVVDVTQQQALNPIAIEQSFCSLIQPYHGFWIMPQWALKQTMTPEFTRVSDSREAAASYPMADLHKTPVVELDGKRVSRHSFAWHLPNNYCRAPESPFGKIKVEDIFL